VARPLDLYDRPDSRFVARFIGQPPMNFLPCLVAKEGANLTIRVVALDENPAWSIPLAEPWIAPLSDRGLPRVDLGLRPEQIQVRAIDDPVAGFDGLARVKRLEPTGHETLAYLGFGPHELVARLPSRTALEPGNRVRIIADLQRACWFDPATGERLE
jgi:ABC-type sugar transport system ATPase subunit